MADATADLKIIERIKKLHAMSISAKEVGSLEEADSFLEGMNKMLAKYNLDASVLSTDTRNLSDPLGYTAILGSTKRHRDKPVRWAQWLAGAVAKAHYCESLVSVTSSTVFFYGRKSNYEIAGRMFVYLRDMAERLGWRAYQKQCRLIREFRAPRVPMNKWYLDYLEGFAVEVVRRYEMMRARVESDRGMSLVLVSVRKEAEDYAKGSLMSPEDVAKATKDQKEAPRGLGILDARLKGQADAQSANLRPNVVDGGATVPNRKMIG